MDIKRFDTIAAVEKGLTFNVVDVYSDAENKETDFKISIVGAGSRIHKKALAQYQTAMASLKKKKVDKEGNLTEEGEDEAIFLLSKFAADCITGWEGLTSGEDEVVYTPEQAHAFMMCAPEVMNQVVQQLQNIKGMLGK